MGYRGKLAERSKARELRAEGMTLLDIAKELGVSKSSVSLWVRDVEFTPGPRRRGQRRGPNALQRRKQAEIDALLDEGRRRIGMLSEREFLVAGAALYAGEGAKRDGVVVFVNSDPRMMAFFASWLRHFFPIDESRLRARVYLHAGLDIDRATEFWSRAVGVPPAQFRRPYRALADATIRTTKHPMGCASLSYCCATTHRAIIGLVAALLSSSVDSGVSQSGALRGAPRRLNQHRLGPAQHVVGDLLVGLQGPVEPHGAEPVKAFADKRERLQVAGVRA